MFHGNISPDESSHHSGKLTLPLNSINETVGFIILKIKKKSLDLIFFSSKLTFKKIFDHNFK
jgi:hypothetical protein